MTLGGGYFFDSHCTVLNKLLPSYTITKQTLLSKNTTFNALTPTVAIWVQL